MQKGHFVTNKFSSNLKREKSLLEIIYIVYRRKWIIISTVFLSLIIAVLYIQLTTPIYQSKALLKKELVDNRQGDEFRELVQLQTSDRLETEMELLKTNDVLRRVINELKLYVKLTKIVDPNGNTWKLNDVFIDFPDSNLVREIGYNLPIFKNFLLLDDFRELELYIEKTSENSFELWNSEENKSITSFSSPSVEDRDSLNDLYSIDSSDTTQELRKEQNGAHVNTNFAKFDFSWNNAPIGSKIYFNIINQLKFIANFREGINVSRVGYTDVFELSVTSPSPFACTIIANSIIRHFREVRMDQQKQMVRYSFNFVDEQLTEIQKKLLNAEVNLSNFKGSGQIMNIDLHTQEVLSYQSTLEAEKLQTEILLSDYKEKAGAIKTELESSGYFDQSFLEPSGDFASSSPFSSLMTHLSDLEMQRLELLQKRTESHPDVVKLNEQINLAKEQLASYNQNTLTSYGIIIHALEKKLQKISSLMSNYESQLKNLPQQENTMARLIREKDVYEKIFNLLLNKREEMRVAELSKLQDIIIVDYPDSPIKPIKPRKFFSMIIALFVGGFLGIVVVFVVQLKKSRLIDLDYLEEELGIPILALIPKYDKFILKRIKNPVDDKDIFVTMHTDNQGIRESYRLLNTKLFQLDLRDKTILVTSCEENTGKTTIVANLAVTMALSDKNILIIDCDLRKGELSKMFNLFQNSPGIIDYIEKGTPPVIYNKVLKKISIIPVGGLRENSSILLNSDRMKSLFQVIDTSIYDFIIVDTPPVTRVVDTLALGHLIKHSILVVRPEISIKETVIGGIQELNNARIKIRGIVANAAEIQKSHYYRYRYGYGYGYSSSDESGGIRGKINFRKKHRSKLHRPTKVNLSL